MKVFIYKILLSYVVVITSVFAEDTMSSNRTVFNDIYEKGEWARDNNGKILTYQWTSGSGSSPENCKFYMEFLKDFLKKHDIKTVVDLGCGDWQFSHLINWNGIQYTGIDVADSVIEKNVKNYSAKNIAFIRADAIEYSLPKADLLLCKEVFQHLPFKDIWLILAQFNKYKYCLILNDVDPTTLTCENVDMSRGAYRPIDLTKPPFSLKGRKVLSYASGLETKQLLLIEN